MSVREILGCFGCHEPGSDGEPHRDFDLKPFGVGYVHERCRLPDDHLDSEPLCTLTDQEHYPDGEYLQHVEQLAGLR